jgi:hypothetical protein
MHPHASYECIAHTASLPADHGMPCFPSDGQR